MRRWSATELDEVQQWYTKRQRDRGSMAALARRMGRSVHGVRCKAFKGRLSNRRAGDIGGNVFALWGEGKSNILIGRILGVSESCIRKWLKRLDLRTNRPHNRPRKETA